MYSEKVMDHFQNPRNVGEIENASGVGTVGNAKCGDIMRMYLDIDENGVIRDCKFKTFGCGAAVATSSMATELVKGKTVQEALQVTNKAVMDALDGLPPVKVHCSLLAEEAIHAALWDMLPASGVQHPPADDRRRTGSSGRGRRSDPAELRPGKCPGSDRRYCPGAGTSVTGRIERAHSNPQ